MRNIFIVVLVSIFPLSGLAGIETVLLEEKQGDCTIRIVHDATPASKIGTIVFRSFTVNEGLHLPCEPTKSQVRESLSKGIAKYNSHGSLKPVTSIMVGKIGNFPWVKSDWHAKSQSGKFKKLSRSELNAVVSSDAISQPFGLAMKSNGLEFDGAICEKIQFYKNGHPMNALCWFKIKGF